jgi:hypothetical protein
MIDSSSPLNAQVTGQVRYDGTMYLFANNGADIVFELASAQLGSKVQTIITVALVDITDQDQDGNNTYEVGNTTVLDAECLPDYEIKLGVSILANKCTHVLQPTYSFNAVVQPGHTYEIRVELRCDGIYGSPGLGVVGCKYGPKWESGLSGPLETAIELLGPLEAYAQPINGIGRPGGLIWANSSISLGSDVVAEHDRLIARLESTIKSVKLKALLNANGEKTEEVIRLVKLPQGQRTK